MGRKWKRKRVCHICEEPISAGRTCPSCKGVALQDDEERTLLPTQSNFSKRLAEGFKILHAPYSDELED